MKRIFLILIAIPLLAFGCNDKQSLNIESKPAEQPITNLKHYQDNKYDYQFDYLLSYGDAKSQSWDTGNEVSFSNQYTPTLNVYQYPYYTIGSEVSSAIIESLTKKQPTSSLQKLYPAYSEIKNVNGQDILIVAFNGCGPEGGCSLLLEYFKLISTEPHPSLALVFSPELYDIYRDQLGVDAFNDLQSYKLKPNEEKDSYNKVIAYLKQSNSLYSFGMEIITSITTIH